MRVFLFLLALTWAVPLSAAPLKSFTYRSMTIPCTGLDTLMPFGPGPDDWKMNLENALPGAGVFPAGRFDLTHVSISHLVTGSPTEAYAVVGHSGPNGDYVSPFAVGTAATATIKYDAGARPLFTPGEYLDVHAACNGGGTHYAVAVFWYVAAE